MRIKRSLASALIAAALLAPGAARAFTLITGLSYTDQSGGMQFSQTVGTTSAVMQIATVNSSFTVVAATYSVNVSFSATDAAGSTAIMSNIQVSTDNFISSVALSSASLVISTGAMYSPPFRVRVTGVTGTVNLTAISFNWRGGSLGYMNLNVLGNTPFTGVSVRNGPTASAGASTSISPDRDGVQDAALIRGSLPALPYWQVVIYSTADLFTPVQSFYASNAYPEVAWYGYDNRGQVVPNGDYLARLQSIGGAIVDNSLTITVNTAFIKGVVVSTPSPGFPLTRINAYGPGGGGFAESATDDGSFEVWGLKAGQMYGLQFNADNYVTQNVNNVSAGTNLGTIAMTQGVQLHVFATRAMGVAGTNPEIWGSLNANTTDYAHNAYGTAHFPSETAISDNGDWNTVLRTTFTVMTVPPNQTIKLQLSMYQYGNFPMTVTSPLAGGAPLDVIFPNTTIVKNPTVAGTVILASTAAVPPGQGVWVSLQGTKQGQSQPSVFGGGWIDASIGKSSATYQVFGVSTGTWTFRTYTQGFKSTSTVVSVPGPGDVNGQNFLISVGGVITGTITLQGDSSTAPPSQQQGGGPGCATGKIPVNIAAWSPASFTGAWTQVCLTTQAVTSMATYQLTGLEDGAYDVYPFLTGFQLNPPSGRLTAVVSSGTSNLDINYKRLSGALVLTVDRNSGNSIFYDASLAFGGGPDSFDQQGSASPAGPLQATATVTGMGTGLYQVVAKDLTSGLIKVAAVAVVNGSTATLSMDMRDVTYTASGVVDLGGSINLPAPWSVTVSSAVGLQVGAALGGSTAPVVQVFSFPLPRNFNGDVKPYQQVAAVPVTGQTYATFTVTGLPAGSYLFRVQNDLNPPVNCQGCGGQTPPGLPEFGTSSQVVLATSNVTGVALTLSNGADVAGTISEPSGPPDGQLRQFDLTLRKDDNLTVYQTTVAITNSGLYAFGHIADGNYSLEVLEHSLTGGAVPKFVAAPMHVTVAGAPVSQNISLLQGGVVVGKLRDTDSNTLITDLNQSQFLSNNFRSFAQANPWVPGGRAEMERCSSGCSGGIYISSVTGQFAIYRLIPGQVYDVVFSGFDDHGGGASSQGQKTYVPFSISGLRVESGQTVDLGIVDLRQGVTLSGQVTLVGSTTPLTNIPVLALPSLLDGADKHDMAVAAFTDQAGNYTLRGIDRNRRFYDMVAAPRPEGNDISSLLSGTKYGQEIKRNVDVPAILTAGTGVNFSLTIANGSLTGRVVTADGGLLVLPSFGDGGGALSDHRAAVFLHLVGAPNIGTDPLGEVQAFTDIQGNFSIDGLKPGVYQMRLISVGYITDLRTLTVNAGANSAGTITLRQGASVSGRISKPDGSSPNTSEVKFVVGVDRDFTEFAFARMDSDSNTNQVTGYHLDGLKTGLSYSLVAVSNGDDILELASGVTFTGSTETRTLDLVYKPTPPAVFVTQTRTGNTYNLRFFSTHKLRNTRPEDNNFTDTSLPQIITCPTCGAGTGSVSTDSTKTLISPSRDTIEVQYDGVPSEASFQLLLAFTSAKVDAESPTGANFVYASTFTFYSGVGASRIVSIPNAVGGECTLEGTVAGGDFPSGTFSSTDTSTNLTNVQVGVRSTTSTLTASSFAAPSARALAAAEGARRLGPAAYPTMELFRAVTAAPDVSQQVFSNFYDVFLPAGVSHTLKKDALITLSYQAGADPSLINVYYFDPGNGVFLLENAKRVVDATNRTITVAVRHLSTFVVLSNNAPVITGDAFAGTAVTVQNFPNPFNLTTKNVTFAHPDPLGATGQTIEGTMIRVGVPAGKSGTMKVEIFDVAGSLVREISKSVSGGAYAYTEWDGRNDGGKKVASGVYLARFTLNDGDEKFFKMAVIK